jgi:hypothetical protein
MKGWRDPIRPAYAYPRQHECFACHLVALTGSLCPPRTGWLSLQVAKDDAKNSITPLLWVPVNAPNHMRHTPPVARIICLVPGTSEQGVVVDFDQPMEALADELFWFDEYGVNVEDANDGGRSFTCHAKLLFVCGDFRGLQKVMCIGGSPGLYGCLECFHLGHKSAAKGKLLIGQTYRHLPLNHPLRQDLCHINTNGLVLPTDATPARKRSSTEIMHRIREPLPLDQLDQEELPELQPQGMATGIFVVRNTMRRHAQRSDSYVNFFGNVIPEWLRLRDVGLMHACPFMHHACDTSTVSSPSTPRPVARCASDITPSLPIPSIRIPSLRVLQSMPLANCCWHAVFRTTADANCGRAIVGGARAREDDPPSGLIDEEQVSFDRGNACYGAWRSVVRVAAVPTRPHARPACPALQPNPQRQTVMAWLCCARNKQKQ